MNMFPVNYKMSNNPLPPAEKTKLGAILLSAFFANTCSVVALATYSVFDPHFSNSNKSFTIDANQYQNWLGMIGSYSADVALNFFGHGAYALPLLGYFFIYKKMRTSGLNLIWDSLETRKRARMGKVQDYNYKYGFFGATGILLLASVADTVLLYDEKLGFDKMRHAEYGIPYHFGGAIGFEISNLFNLYNSTFVASLFFCAGLWISTQMLFNVSYFDLISDKLEERARIRADIENTIQSQYIDDYSTAITGAAGVDAVVDVDNFDDEQQQDMTTVEEKRQHHTTVAASQINDDNTWETESEIMNETPQQIAQPVRRPTPVVAPKARKGNIKLPNPADFLHLETTQLTERELHELNQKRIQWGNAVLTELANSLHKRFNQEKKINNQTKMYEIIDKSDPDERVSATHFSPMMNQMIFHIHAGGKVNTSNFLNNDNTTNIARSIGDAISLYTLNSKEVENIQNGISIYLKGKGFAVAVPLPSALRKKYSLITVLNEHIKTDTDMQKLTLRLGLDNEDNVVTNNLLLAPHSLIAGKTRSGKSVFCQGMLTNLTFANSPQDLRLVIIDPKGGVDYSHFERSPHLLFPIINHDVEVRKSNPNEMYMGIKVIEWIVQLVEHRYKILKSVRLQNWSELNSKIQKGQVFKTPYNTDFVENFDYSNTENEYIINEKQPYIFVLVDEYAEAITTLKEKSPKDKDTLEAAISRLAQKARAAGVHLALGMQRPDSSVIEGQIKANLSSRFGFAVAGGKSQSNIILPNSEYDLSKLQGAGDAVFAVVDENGIESQVPLQSPYISSDEIAAVVDWWHERVPQNLLDLDLLESVQENSDDDTNNSANSARSELKEKVVEAVRKNNLDGMTQTAIANHINRNNDAAKKIINELVEEGLLVKENGHYHLA